jgi:hypothetical protein
VTYEPLTPAERQQWDEDRQKSRNPGGKTDAEIAAQTKADDAQVVNVSYTGTGKGRQKVTTYKSGRKATEAAPQNPTAVSVSYDKDGTKVTKYDDGTETREQQNPVTAAQEGRAASKDAFGVEPEGAPEFTAAIGQVTAGLRTYSAWLSQQVKLYHDTNGAQGVAPAEASKLMERRIALAEGAIKEQQSLESSQKGLLDNATTQRGQTLGDTRDRRSTANAFQQNTLNQLLPMASKLGEGGAPLLNAAINDTLRSGIDYATAWGGMRESPEINPDSFPALAQARQAAMAGITTAAQGGPKIFESRPVSAQVAASANAMANPAFKPAPMVPPANNPIDGSPVVLPTQLPTATPPLGQGQDLGGTPVAPAPSGPPARDDYRQSTPVVNPPMDSAPIMPMPNQMPVDVPYPSNAGAVSQRPSPRFMQETRYGQGVYFDPNQAGAELSARLGIDPEIMRQAIGGLYG